MGVEVDLVWPAPAVLGRVPTVVPARVGASVPPRAGCVKPWSDQAGRCSSSSNERHPPGSSEAQVMTG